MSYGQKNYADRVHPTMHIFTKNVSKIDITLNLNRIRPAEISNKDENENMIMLRTFV